MVNACSKNVTTKTAITTVPATDWTVDGQSPPSEIFSLHDIGLVLSFRLVGRVAATGNPRVRQQLLDVVPQATKINAPKPGVLPPVRPVSWSLPVRGL